jgi:hypothetical protein
MRVHSGYSRNISTAVSVYCVCKTSLRVRNHQMVIQIVASSLESYWIIL